MPEMEDGTMIIDDLSQYETDELIKIFINSFVNNDRAMGPTLNKSRNDVNCKRKLFQINYSLQNIAIHRCLVKSN